MVSPVLPAAFCERLAADMGQAEAGELCRALDEPSPTSIRLHPLRGSRLSGGRPIPWSPGGIYLDERPAFTLDPEFHAGAYYVQEASSQFVGHLAAGENPEGKRILDLCAAPGGKTTIYSTLAGPAGLVVANEVNRSRAGVLADNVRKWGLGNVAVTMNEPAQVAAFRSWFDIVAVDAPCSGEGMFRRLPESRTEWNENNVRLCAARQLNIFTEAWKALKPGGLLIYSTCTFNRTENEGVLENFLRETGQEIADAGLVPVPDDWGVVTGQVGPFRTFRFYPNRLTGEGFFAAVARKSYDAGGREQTPKARRSPIAPVPRSEEKELQSWVTPLVPLHFAAVGDTRFGFYKPQWEALKALAGNLNVIASGVEMGQIFKGILRPDHALSMFAGLDKGRVPAAELAEDQALHYLRKQEIPASLFAEGLNLVRYGGLPLGFAKRISNRVNNMYPNTLRIVKR